MKLQPLDVFVDLEGKVQQECERRNIVVPMFMTLTKVSPGVYTFTGYSREAQRMIRYKAIKMNNCIVIETV